MFRASHFLIGIFCLVLSPSSFADDHNEKPVYYIYLAGPEVFLPEPIKAGDDKKATIKRLNKHHKWPFTLVGLYPMDNDIANFAHDRKTGLAIYRANIELMDKADYITANMVRFRGPSMDVGTAFEMGYMRGLKKPVFAYYDALPFYGKDEAPGRYQERVATHYHVHKDDAYTDIHGQSIERFDMADNLMMIGALDDTDTTIQSTFEEAIKGVAQHIMAKNKVYQRRER